MRRKTLPQVSPKVANELKPLVTAIKEIIETGEGVRGDPLDRKITLRDLVDGGIVKIKGGLSPNNPGSLEPSPPPPNLSVPPAPTGFNAIGGFDGHIDLTWDIPGSLYSNHAYTNIYRAEEDNFANAILVGREAGAFYTDIVRDDVVPTPYYYWISFTSTSDIEGPLNATAGTLAQALDIDWIVSELNGKISESELANELLTPIQAIPGIQTTLSDHGGRIASTEAALSDLLNISVYDTSTDYAVDDLVSYNDKAWRALVAMTAPAPTPTEGANWTEVGNYATFSDLIAANAVAIDDLDVRVTANDGEITSNATDITALGVRVTDTESDLAANTSAIGTLDSRVTVVEGTVTANSSDITLLQSDLTTAQSDISGNSTALNLLDTRVTTAENTISANSADITQLQADVQALDVDGNAQAIQNLDVRVTANENDITAIASDVTTLTASVDGNTSAIQTKAEVSAVQAVESDVAVLSAQYTIKLDVNGYVSGIGLSNDGTGSEFIVASDAVYFIDPGQSITPFDPNTNYSSMAAARDTQLVFGYAEIEGFKRFVINVPAYIPEGYIESGMVGAISFGKITTDTGVPVTTVSGKLKADYIDVDNLAVASAATFYGDAQSGNFQTGVQGWKLWQSGNLEANNATVRGHVEMETGYISDQIQIGGVPQFSNFRPGNFLRNGASISASAPVSNLNYLTDGIRSISSNYWELSSGVQYLQADLGFEALVSESRMFFYALDGRQYLTAIAVSRDGSTWEYVLGSGPADGGSATSFVLSREAAGGYLVGYELPTIVPVGKFARYVRVWMNGNSVNTGNHGYEWELYGAGGGGEDPYTASIGSTTEDWVRPGTTLIDGNKIFTGDAYVDTLQIKGQAVTFPRGAFASNAVSFSSSGTNVLSLSVTATGAPIIILISFVATGNATRSSGGIDLAIRRGTTSLVSMRAISARQIGTNENVTYEVSGGFTYQYYMPAPTSGTYYINLKGSSLSSGICTIRSITVLEAKR